MFDVKQTLFIPIHRGVRILETILKETTKKSKFSLSSLPTHVISSNHTDRTFNIDHIFQCTDGSSMSMDPGSCDPNQNATYAPSSTEGHVLTITTKYGK